MNQEDLHIKLNYLGPSGHTLSLEHRTALQISLPILKKNCKFARVVFWGKILGINRDYLIAQGFGNNIFEQVKYFCSHDGVAWVQLPELDEQTSKNCDLIKGRLIGDASNESTLESNQVEGESPKKKIVITEEKRLAQLIQTIDKDTSVVPRGAFTITAQHKVVINPTFQGLSTSESQNLKFYQHLREPITLLKKTLLMKEGLTRTLDFMDTINEDTPNGCWTLNIDKVSNLVSLRSLLWPGFFAYHVANTPNFGCAYFGTGEKNLDLAFML